MRKGQAFLNNEHGDNIFINVCIIDNFCFVICFSRTCYMDEYNVPRRFLNKKL